MAVAATEDEAVGYARALNKALAEARRAQDRVNEAESERCEIARARWIVGGKKGPSPGWEAPDLVSALDPEARPFMSIAYVAVAVPIVTTGEER